MYGMEDDECECPDCQDAEQEYNWYLKRHYPTMQEVIDNMQKANKDIPSWMFEGIVRSRAL